MTRGTFKGLVFASGALPYAIRHPDRRHICDVHRQVNNLGNAASGTINFYRASGRSFQQERATPSDVDAQVAAGRKVRIPDHTLTGIDADGDDDQLSVWATRRRSWLHHRGRCVTYLVYEVYADPSGNDTFVCSRGLETGQRAQAQIRVGVRAPAPIGVAARDDEITL